ncbi:MAG: hypothetical protein B6I20_11595 [Bacteroidetes bacterium 4572_117]|nr:MAG: hypothetical protein B6I20_11595 [Bacteroidetes bacterium 4572_117]
MLSLIYFFQACTKEVEPPVPASSDNISGKTVRYTVLVVPGGNTSFKSVSGVDTAIVSLVMNDSIYSVATDTNGLAAFDNLAAGVAAVTVTYKNHTTAKLIVDLSAPNDTGYDSNNLRNAATMVPVFPLSGKGTATIKGRVFAELDLSSAGIENAPTGTKITSLLESLQLLGYVNHTGDGEILDIAYNEAVYSTNTDINSDYSITVPATASGLKIVINADDFDYEQITGVGTIQRKTYSALSDTVSVFSGVTYFRDIIYN